MLSSTRDSKEPQSADTEAMDVQHRCPSFLGASIAIRSRDRLVSINTTRLSELHTSLLHTSNCSSRIQINQILRLQILPTRS
jgi:hypothetical protein